MSCAAEWKHPKVLSDHTISRRPDCALDAIDRVSLRYDRSSETRRSALDLARRRSAQKLEFARRSAGLRGLWEKVQGSASGHPPLARAKIETVLSYSGMHIDAGSVDIPGPAGRSGGWNELAARRNKKAGTPRVRINAANAGLSRMIGSTLDQPGVASAPDEVLMKHISSRRQEALAELYGRHSKRLRATIDGVVHEEAEADDVLQEIFLQVWEEAGRYSPTAGKPLGWMVTIARRRAIDRLRRRQAYSRARERYENRVSQESQTPRRDGTEKLIQNDLRKFLKKSIRTLPRFQREAVELAFFNGLSHREIAAVTHAPLGTVKTRLELGLQKLTHALRPLRHKV